MQTGPRSSRAARGLKAQAASWDCKRYRAMGVHGLGATLWGMSQQALWHLVFWRQWEPSTGGRAPKQGVRRAERSLRVSTPGRGAAPRETER